MNSRNQSLDVLRGIAVLMVLVFHYHFSKPVPLSRLGWSGVDLFFVLSGFLISGLLFKEYSETGSIDIPRFLLRRGLKIWPALYFCLAASGLLLMVTWQLSEFPSRAFIFVSLFVGNYHIKDLMFLSHTWSLAVEEHFYLLLPVIIRLLLWRKDRLHLIPFLWVATLLACIIGRSAAHANLLATQCRIDGLFTGVMLRYVCNFHPQFFERMSRHYVLPIIGACFAPILLLDLESSLFMRTFGLTLLSFGFALLLAWFLNRAPRGPIAVAVAFVGVYSYSIYLWQFLASFVADAFLPGPIRFPAYLSLAILTGIGAAKMIEMPVLKFRDKVLPMNGARVKLFSVRCRSNELSPKTYDFQSSLQ